MTEQTLRTHQSDHLVETKIGIYHTSESSELSDSDAVDAHVNHAKGALLKHNLGSITLDVAIRPDDNELYMVLNVYTSITDISELNSEKELKRIAETAIDTALNDPTYLLNVDHTIYYSTIIRSAQLNK